jgi:Zn-dependent protease with chaperone function
VRQLQAFLREKGFRVRDLLNWPVFEGKMMTAGIMGVVPRYRYILIADSLMEFLSLEELKAVVAHEMAHARYRHLLFYILFFVGFMTLSFGLFDILTILLSAHPFFSEAMEGRHTHRISLFYLALSVPMVTSLLIYFRYIMGFFMRHFERQADLFSAFIMGTPRYTIRSLEKIADLTGKSRDLPSWHHFSIRERVETLFRSLRHPNLLRRQGRFLILSLAVYFLSMGILGTFLHYGPVKVHLTYALAEKLLTEKLAERPESIPLLQTLAEVYHYREKYEAALGVYEKIIELDPDQAVALNNLAWHLVTLPRKELRNPPRALELAKRAASLQRSAFILDTLAEAYYANGQVSEAVKSIKEALALAREGRGYYEAQLRRFSAAQ